MRRVMIGTPCYDWRADVRYIHSLTQTIRMGLDRAIDVREMFPVGNSLIQDARNEAMQLAVQFDFDDLVFIDSDQDWEPPDFFKLLAYPVDCVGVPIRRKTDDFEVFNVKAKGGPESIVQDAATGLWTAPDMTVGTGMLRLSKKAIRALWDGAAQLEYGIFGGDGSKRRWIFNIGPHNGELMSEDVFVGEKLREYGIPTWIDPTIKVGHIGLKRFTGDFVSAVAKLKGGALVPTAA